MGPDRPETVCDRAKMNLAGHRVRRLSENYFEPCMNKIKTEQPRANYLIQEPVLEPTTKSNHIL